MKPIDMKSYDRINEFNRFIQDKSALFSITAELDVTNFYEFISNNNKPYFISLLYPITRIANEILQFRHRADNDEKTSFITECAHISPSIPTGNSQLNRFTAEYYNNYFRFVEYTIAGLELIKENEDKSEHSSDGAIYVTSVPIGSFSSVQHIVLDSFAPSVVCSEPVKNGEKYSASISVMAHAALMDYSHIADFIEKMQEFVGYPEQYINSIATSEKEEINYDTRIIRSSSLSQRLRSEYPYAK